MGLYTTRKVAWCTVGFAQSATLWLCRVICIYTIDSPNTRLRWDFPRPPGERHFGGGERKKKFGAPWAPHLGQQLTLPSASIKNKIKKISGAPGAPNGFDPFHEDSKYHNMCLVLKLDNGKVVSIANEQTDRQIYRQRESHSHPAAYYNIDMFAHTHTHTHVTHSYLMFIYIQNSQLILKVCIILRKYH